MKVEFHHDMFDIIATVDIDEKALDLLDSALAHYRATHDICNADYVRIHENVRSVIRVIRKMKKEIVNE